MGAVDLVVQVEAPDSVATGLQRVGRGGHQVGAVSRGVFFPKYRGDLLECAVVVERMRAGAIEALRYAAQPARRARAADRRHGGDGRLDGRRPGARRPARGAVRRAAARGARRRARHARRSLPVRRLRRAAPAHHLGPHDAAPRAAPAGAQRLAVTSGGTIPDRGLYGVFLAGEHPTRVGELDEEMVYESRVGEVFLLGASSWRIEDITHDRVIVSPAPGQPGKMPFWHGDAPGRPLELGAAIGRFVRELGEQGDGRCARAPARRRSRRVGGRQPAPLPRGAARSDGRRPRRSHDRRRALPRRRRRLARVRALVLRRARARAVGAGHRGAASPAPRRHGAVDVHRRRHRDPRAGRGRRAARRRGVLRPRGGRGAGDGRGGRLGALRQPLPRVRGARAAAAAAPAGRAHAALAAAPAERGTAPGREPAPRRSRSCWRPTASACRTSSTCRRSPSCCRRGAAARGPRGRGRHRAAVALRRARSSSATSAPSSTRATRRSPSAARRRCRSTARCWPS